MEWSPPPRRSSSPAQTSIRDSISLQMASSASSSISTSATNNSTAATSSMSITPDREAGGITDTIVSKVAHAGEGAAETGGSSGTDVDAGTEAATDDDVGEVKEEGEGREAGQEASHAQEASGQTRATRKSWYRTVIPETPTTFHPEGGRAVTPAPTPPGRRNMRSPAPTPPVRRILRSAAKSTTSEASGHNRKGAPGTGDKTRRQSKRLMEATKLAASTTPAPTRGKRSHEAMAAGSKSANAKLQNSTPTTTATSNGDSKDSQTPLRFSKRTKKVLSYNEDVHDEQFVLSLARSASELTSKLQGGKRKNWLNQGLYLGQEQDIDVTKRPVGGLTRTRRGHTTQARRSVLPLPMFTGLRIMDTERDFKLPFNIYAPSPWKCGPIQDWRKLNHNVLIGDAAAHWKREKASTAKCVCTENQGCDEDCLNACTWVECDDGNCNVGAERCKNRAFADLKERVRVGTKFAEGVEVVKTANCGHGLRATRSFEPNQIIVEYTGEIITQEESERRMVEVYKDNKNYYLMLFHQNMILDATRGSVARFVNHSCNPNCTMEKWLVEGRPRMALFAGDGGVEAGMELTYDYNFNWFTGVSQQTCHCGAKNCRGALGKKADGFQGKPSPSVKGKGKESSARSSARSNKSSKNGRVASKSDNGKGNLKKPAPVARSQKPNVLGPGRGTRTRRRSPPPREPLSSSEGEVVLVAAPGTNKGVEHEVGSDEENDLGGEVENDVERKVETGVEHQAEQEADQRDDCQSVGGSSSPSRPKSAPNLTNFGGSPRLRGGRLRHLKTYKIGKTIRERTPGSRATSASGALGLRRSARRSFNPGAVSNAADTTAPLLGQALATALVTGVEVDGVIASTTGMKMLNSVPVTA